MWSQEEVEPLEGGEVIRVEGEVLRNRISAFTKQTLESAFIPSTLWGHSEELAM